jgi:6-phosphogluconolactonase
MEISNLNVVDKSHRSSSRRAFLRGLAAMSVAPYVCAHVVAAEPARGGRILAYLGTDTKPVDGAANGKGIYLFEMNPVTGVLSLIKLAAETVSPSWLALAPSAKFLYAINEVSDYPDNQGSVSAFAIDRPSGSLKPLNVVGSGGAGPTHLSLDASGKYVFVANYFGGNIAVISILPDGSLGECTFTHQDKGELGNLHATDGPPGSFAISGHDTPHAHMIQPDPSNRFVLQTDLGQDRVYVYKFDRSTGKLTPAATPYVSFPPGDGPRHFALHPNGHWMYSIQEEASTIACFRYDSSIGSLLPEQTISTLPSGFKGTNFCSEIVISPDGKSLYAANRLHNSIAVFKITVDGRLSLLGETLTQGDYPNHVSLDPTGRFLYVCNQRSDQITSFRRNVSTGLLAFTGQYTPIGTPMCLTFLV